MTNSGEDGGECSRGRFLSGRWVSTVVVFSVLNPYFKAISHRFASKALPDSTWTIKSLSSSYCTSGKRSTVELEFERTWLK